MIKVGENFNLRSFYLFLSSFLFIPLLGYTFHRIVLMESGGALLNRGTFIFILDARGILELGL